jgi:hypothetical protein
MIRLSLKDYVIIALVLFAIGQFVFNKINNKDALEVELEYKEKIKKEKQIVREEANKEIEKLLQDTQDTIDKLLEQNARIIYKPYERRIYVDRSLDSALHVMQRAKGLLQQ